MIRLAGKSVRLRALEPADVEPMYVWENDPAVWRVSGTLSPFSRQALTRFIEEQSFDIFQTRQLRLIIENPRREAVGAVDLFEFDPQHRRAGIGILIHDTSQRRKGYASEALRLLVEYAREVLGLHQLWCGIEAENTASLALFRRAGFRKTGVKRDWLRDAAGYHDEWLFQKILE